MLMVKRFNALTVNAISRHERTRKSPTRHLDEQCRARRSSSSSGRHNPPVEVPPPWPHWLPRRKTHQIPAQRRRRMDRISAAIRPQLFLGGGHMSDDAQRPPQWSQDGRRSYLPPKRSRASQRRSLANRDFLGPFLNHQAAQDAAAMGLGGRCCCGCRHRSG
jgi:hypothetical protein